MNEAPTTLAERYTDRQLPEAPEHPESSDEDEHREWKEADDAWRQARAKLIRVHLRDGEKCHRRIQDRAAAGDGTMTITVREWDALRAYREDHGFGEVLLDDSSRALLQGVVVTVKHEEFQHVAAS